MFLVREEARNGHIKTNEVSFSCVNNEVKKTRRGWVAINDASFVSIVTI